MSDSDRKQQFTVWLMDICLCIAIYTAVVVALWPNQVETVVLPHIQADVIVDSLDGVYFAYENRTSYQYPICISRDSSEVFRKAITTYSNAKVLIRTSIFLRGNFSTDNQIWLNGTVTFASGSFYWVVS